MLTKKQYAKERKVESNARRFVMQTFRNAMDAYRSKNEYKTLIVSGYATQNGKHIDLVGYKELNDLIHSLTSAELKKFILIFFNHVHQAAYHICKRDLTDFEKDSKRVKAFLNRPKKTLAKKVK
ncbi:MAG TPA: hypothetical protein VJK72_04685 [Candidatus Nanoarchaeia archaeon]|nr:hypothetical protein [Candidatus Nanoarchaeia archaeon]